MTVQSKFKYVIVISLVACLAAFAQYNMERSSFSSGKAKAGGAYSISEAAAGQNVSIRTWYESGADSFYIWQGYVQINHIPVIFSASACDTYPDPLDWNFVDLSGTNPVHVRYQSYSNMSGGLWRTSLADVYGGSGATGGTTDTLWLDEYVDWEYVLQSDASEAPPYDYTRWNATTTGDDYTGTVDYTEWANWSAGTEKHQLYFQQYEANIDIVYEPSGVHVGEVDLVRWYQFGNDATGLPAGSGLDEDNDWSVITGPQWVDAGSNLEFPENTDHPTEPWYTVSLRDWEKLDKNLDKQIVYGQPTDATLTASMVAWRGYVLMGVPLYPLEDTTAYRVRHVAVYGSEPACWPPTTRGDQDVMLYDDFWADCSVPDGGTPGKYEEWWRISRFYPALNSYFLYNGPCDPPNVDPFWPGRGYWLVQDHCDSVDISEHGLKPDKTSWYNIPLAVWDGLHDEMFYNMCANPFYKNTGGGDVFDVLWHDAEIMRYSGDPLVLAEILTVAEAAGANYIDAAIRLWDGNDYYPVSCLIAGPNYDRSFLNWEGFWLSTASGVPVGDSLALRMKTTDYGGRRRRTRPQPEPELIAGWDVRIGLHSDEIGDADSYNGFGFKEYVDMAAAQPRMRIDEMPDFAYPAPHIRMWFIDSEDNRYSYQYKSERTSVTIFDAVLDCRSAKTGKISVRWDIQSIPEGFTLFIEDPEHEEYVDMREESEYTFESTGGIHKVRIIATAPLAWVSKETTEDARVPEEFFLAGPTPNPFNAVTRLDFGIPEGEGGPVRIDVFDILGHKVNTLMDAELDPGFYNVTWQGNDFSGQTIGSGNYFIRYVGAGRNVNRKVSLIK